METNELETYLFNNIEKLPTGCQYCIKGEKLVLFITGLCGENCFYCPVSENRKEKDVIYANEKRISSIEEAIEEAKICGSKGVGITGGAPLQNINRTCEYLKALKNEFGSNFHAHLYTTPKYIDENTLKALKDSGLDEIRIHFTNLSNISDKDMDILKLCMKYIGDVGVELPAIPNNELKIINLAEKLNNIGVKFLNLNELEYSETNYEKLIKLGFKEKNEYSSSMVGSEETAQKVINHFKNDKDNKNNKLIIHYCPSALKDGIQMKNRLINRAKNIAKDYEIITEEGLLLKGIIVFRNNEEINDVVDILKDNDLPFEIKNNNLYLNPCSLEELLEELKNINYDIKFSAYISECYPTNDGLEVERTPLFIKKRSLREIRKK